MKNTLILASFLAMGMTSLKAQNSMFDLGLEGGPNLSTVFVKSTMYDFDPDQAIYWSGGAIFQYNFKNFLSIKTGFSYQRKGFQLNDILFVDNSGNTVAGKGKFNTRLDYLTFPVLVKASFGKKVQFFVNAGPYAGYLLQKTDRTQFNNSSSTQKEELNGSGFNRWDFGIAGGVGIAVPIRTFWVITVEARNYSGILDIATSSKTQWRTNTTDLRVGVAYKLGFYKDEE
jgi:hypothetical protein